MFQEYSRSLMPWASVRNNVLLPLRHKPLSRARAHDARRGVARRGRADPVHRPLPVAALRRHAAARRDRARARLPAVDPADGRAVRVGRRADARRPRGPRPAGAGASTASRSSSSRTTSTRPSTWPTASSCSPTRRRPSSRSCRSTIPFPRDQIETKELPEFAHLRAHVYRLIKRDEEVAPEPETVEPAAEG